MRMFAKAGYSVNQIGWSGQESSIISYRQEREGGDFQGRRQ